MHAHFLATFLIVLLAVFDSASLNVDCIDFYNLPKSLDNDFSTSEFSQMCYCYQKLEICGISGVDRSPHGSGPVPSQERTPMRSVLANQRLRIENK